MCKAPRLREKRAVIEVNRTPDVEAVLNEKTAQDGASGEAALDNDTTHRLSDAAADAIDPKDAN